MADAILLLDVGNTRLRWAIDVDGSFLAGGNGSRNGQTGDWHWRPNGFVPRPGDRA